MLKVIDGKIIIDVNEFKEKKIWKRIEKKRNSLISS